MLKLAPAMAHLRWHTSNRLIHLTQNAFVVGMNINKRYAINK